MAVRNQKITCLQQILLSIPIFISIFKSLRHNILTCLSFVIYILQYVLIETKWSLFG